MKTALIVLLSILSSIVFAQDGRLKIKKGYLSEQAKFGGWEISTRKNLLNKSLSESLVNNVVRSSEPYTISNISEIKALIDTEKYKPSPDLLLSLNIFRKREALNLSITRIDTRQGREILRGTVDGYEESKVKLVVYNGQMTGRITLSKDPSVYVIRSVNGGISASYEIDTSDITYD